MSAHPYPDKLVRRTEQTLGKAFEFAEKCLPGGMAGFFHVLGGSAVGRSFEGPHPDTDALASGITFVLDVVDGSAQSLDLMLLNERKLSHADRDRAHWCGAVMARLQWETGKPFRALEAFPGMDALEAWYREWEAPGTEDAVARILSEAGGSPAQTNLARLRAAAGLSQSQLASASGVSLRSIQQYEQRKKDIDHAQARSVLRLAQALGCSMEELLEEE